MQQTTTDSTVSYTQAETDADRRSMIEYYVDQLLRRVVERPYDSIPQLFQYATRGGPCLSQADVLRLFGGRIIFRSTCRRMNMIRRAVLNDTMSEVPVDLRTWEGQERPEMDPPYTDYRHLWCPSLDCPTLFWYVTENMEEEIYRYPAVLCTDEYFEETDNESDQTEMGQSHNMDSDDWFEARNPVDGARFWVAEDDQSPVDMGVQIGEEESGDEEWGQPPPINTLGPEWFYE